MKDLAAALEEDLVSSGIPKQERVELILDGKCRVTDLSCLAGMDALSKLSLCNVGLSSLHGFPSLPNLSKLVLADNRVLDGLQHLVTAGLPMLKALSLAHNRFADIRELEPLKELHLTHLDLGECPLAQNTENYRQTVLDMFPELEVLDNLDRDGIELLDDEDEEETSEEDEVLEDEESYSDEPMDEPELLNLVTDSEDEEEEEEHGGHEESEPEEIHVSVLAGPPIEDEKSDEDQDYIMPDDEPESEEGSFESDEHVSVSHHFAAGASSSGPAAGSSSEPPSGTKRKRTTHGTEDLHRDFRQDEDYADI